MLFERPVTDLSKAIEENSSSNDVPSFSLVQLGRHIAAQIGILEPVQLKESSLPFCPSPAASHQEAFLWVVAHCSGWVPRILIGDELLSPSKYGLESAVMEVLPLQPRTCALFHDAGESCDHVLVIAVFLERRENEIHHR
jgi:hypothetical protein